MYLYEIFLAGCLLKTTFSTPVGSPSALQAPLEYLTEEQASSRQLHGRFLHITDLHPDPFYKIHSSTEEEDACHRGKGVSGTYGAETTDCDTPFALVNATFKWIEENLKDTIDFVIWTGDSARHDNDEAIPRTQKEVLDTNTWIADKFAKLFSDPTDPNALGIPIISTFGNNDILPHNILLSGPNRWLKAYTNIWSKFIPEEQRHGFERGGWYYVEVIPNKLAVFSLNTLYFFNNNAAVDGCALRSEPGYEHFEWLRVQLQFMRDRGMKAILTGHVPPARTDSKQLWDETCWQKYTLWLRQYRDVVIGGLYGHMNIDHFMFQDQKQIDLAIAGGEVSDDIEFRASMDEELTIESASSYLEELRDNWSNLPNPSVAIKQAEVSTSEDTEATKKKSKKPKPKKPKKTKKEKMLKKMGGPWGERFQLTLVSPSLVPNYFPTLRVVEYNISGLDPSAIWANTKSEVSQSIEWRAISDQSSDSVDEIVENPGGESALKKKKKPKKPDLVIPLPPSTTAPPGPGYSPQTLTLVGYKQYFANLTHINNDKLISPDDTEDVDADKWHQGKHKGKHAKNESKPKPFKYQIEYDTLTDKVYKLKDLTVNSYLKLAHRIGQAKPEKGDEFPTLEEDDDHLEHDSDNEDDSVVEIEKKSKNKVWLSFIQRAFVQTLADEELDSFKIANSDFAEDNGKIELHDGEL